MVRRLWLFALLSYVGLVGAQVGVRRIEGVVYEIGTGRPLPNVRVSTGTTQDAPAGVTDPEGKFSISGLDPNTYQLTAMLEGYSARDPLRRAPGGNKPSVRVVAGALEASRADVYMVKLGSITGRVTSSTGLPMPMITVYTARRGYNDRGEVDLIGQRVSSGTQDRGDFRLAGLEPGSYFIHVLPQPIDLGRGGAPFVPTFYPGTGELRDAVAVDVRPGEETRTNDIVLAPPAKTELRLRLVNETGGGLPPSVNVRVRQGIYTNLQFSSPIAKVEGGDYVFLVGLPLGDHDISVSWTTPSAGRRVGAVLRVALDREKVEREIRITPNHTVEGTVFLERDPDQLMPLSNVVCTFRSRGVAPALTGTSNADGMFRIQNVLDGEYYADCPTIPEANFLHSITVDSRDVLDAGLLVNADLKIRVIVRPRGGTVTATIRESRQRPGAGAQFVLVPDNLRATHRYRTAVADASGVAPISGVAPGKYLAYAWRELEGAAYRNGSFMANYITRGQEVTVEPEGSVSIDLALLDGAN